MNTVRRASDRSNAIKALERSVGEMPDNNRLKKSVKDKIAALDKDTLGMGAGWPKRGIIAFSGY